MKKKILISLFLLFTLFFLSTKVQAKDSAQDVYNYSRVRQEGDVYYIDYVRFNEVGKHAGTLKLTSEMYNKPHWLLYVNKEGRVSYYYPDVSENEAGGFVVFHDYNPDRTYFMGANFETNTVVSWHNCDYNFESQSWGDLKNFSGSYIFMRSSGGTFYPSADNIIMTKDCGFKYNTKNAVGGIAYQFAKKDQFLVSPELKYLVGRGFRLYLNDFNWLIDTTNDETFTMSLTNLILNIYDFKTQTYTTEKVDILDYYDIQTDEDGNAYVDLLFTDILSYLNIVDGDFLVSVISTLDTDYCYSGFKDYAAKDCYRTKTKYSSIDFWRYRHDSETGAGILIPTDENGEGNEPTPSPTIDPTQEAIKNQTDAINNQTETIKEQTEVSKNIFQQIIELPRKDNRTIIKCIEVFIYTK